MDGVSGSRPTSSAHNVAVASDLQHTLDKLRAALPDREHRPSSATLQLLADDFRSVRQILIDHVDRGQARDAFRQADGFLAVLEALKSLEGWYEPGSVTRDERADFFGLLKAALDVLSESLHGHVGNQRFFRKRVVRDDGGGWAALERGLEGTGAGRGSDDGELGQAQLFGTLLAFSLGEETLTRALSATRDAIAKARTADNTKATVEGTSPARDDAPADNHDASDATEAQLDTGQAVVKQHLSGTELLLNPDALPMVVRFLKVQDPLACATLLFINEIADMSTFNAVAMHGAGLLHDLIPLGLSGTEDESCTLAARSLVRKLLPLGLQDPAAAQTLFERAATSTAASQLLLATMRASKSPPFVQFDHSLHGYSAIELPTLGRTFPPLSPSLGYTFAGWVKIDRFDPECHTTVFGACDASQKCFILAYLEKDSHQFILQTSVSPAESKPSVRFRSTVFEEGIWYHIAIVHRRPRNTSSSKAALFVNGRLVEQLKCQYPAQPVAAALPRRGSTESFASTTSKNTPTPRLASVQAFLGTPQDLASRLGRNVVKTRWSLGTFHLFCEALSDELITVYQKIGPRYNGNYQDCLGSFQTYQASAELNLYNEILHPGKEDHSQIAAAIKGKGSAVLPEALIAFSFSPTNILDDNDNNNVNETQLIKSLSTGAASTLHKYVRGGHAIAVNAAIPSVNEALTLPQGVAFLVGEPVVAVPKAMDALAWCVSGFVPLTLRLVALAENDDALLRAVDILFAGFEGSWRNSEAMEKDNGAAFAALMTLLREKLDLGSSSSETGVSNGAITAVPSRSQHELQQLADGLLIRILNLVGFNPERPDESVLINPLAYRVLLLDFDTWTRMPVATQQLYYRQIGLFVENNKYQSFNAKRLIRIRIIKRLLDLLKGGTMLTAAFPQFLRSLAALVKCSQSADVLRALALFVTYALHDSRAIALAAKRARVWPGVAGSESSTPPAKFPELEPRMERADIGIKILEIYTDLLCDPTTTSEMKRFAKTVSNKWLLYLLAEPSPQAVFLSAKLLARLIVLHGPHYSETFNERSGGYSIMKLRLRNWWNMPAMWTICFAILFGYDVALIDFEQDFNLFSLIDTFPESQLEIVHPEMLTVIGAMLEAGLRSIVNERNSVEPERAPSPDERPTSANNDGQTLQPPQHSRPRSMSLRKEDENAKRDGAKTPEQRITSDAEVLQAVIHFLADLHDKHNAFRNFALTSSYVQELLFILYPIVVTADAVSPETELYSRGSALNFEGRDVVIRPHHGSATQDPPVVRTSFVEPPPSPTTEQAMPLRRGSSFVLLTKDKRQNSEPDFARLTPTLPTKSANTAPVSLQVGNALVEGLLEVVVGIFLDQILSRKDFTGFGLFLKVPPGFQEHQAYFETYVLNYAMNALQSTFKLRQKLMTEPRVLTNIARYVLHMAEAVFEGWFLDGAEPLLDFIGQYLEYLQKPEIAALKDVRLCGGAVTTMRQVFYRVVLLRLSELHHATDRAGTVAFLNKMVYWQTVMLGSDETEGYWLRLICYLLYIELINSDTVVRTAAANLWRMILVQKPVETTQLIGYYANSSQQQLSAGFLGLAHTDNESFLHWIDEHRSDLNSLFFGSMSQAWETFVKEENAKTEESAKSRIAKRKEKLRQWHVEQARAEDVCKRHETSTPHWRHNVHSAERLKHQRALQDQQENLAFTATTLAKSKQRLEEPIAVFAPAPTSVKWQLDETEGRNRMRLRMIRDRTIRQEAYQPKRRKTVASRNNLLKLDTNVKPVSARDMIGATPAVSRAPEITKDNDSQSGRARSNSQLTTDSARQDEEYEIVEDPNDDEVFDDKKRRVQRSLQMHDSILSVCNVARIVGLEAVEGLLVIGKDNLYMMDEFFERSDKEVVRSWQAPAEERDPYLQLISGNRQATPARRSNAEINERSAKNWSWSEMLSFSKRRFLFRDVAIEVFFTDGRSYLLTCKTPFIRDDLYLKLVARAPHVHNSTSSLDPEDRWRLEALRNPEEVPQGLGTKFASVFNQVPSNPATKRWLRCDLSNFAYLMLINTMAGRTFNDLTQYPVFPWVIADYRSEELDLSDPRTFRDFSKPMGCQTASREAEFRERYNTFAEMGDHNAPAFHYGTHYSSAMIVTSYLIRLQPFVQSYLLLQGGSFDHADRLFYSIEKAWLSASRENMTDVRELTPEFYYLPDFLTNVNQYDFGAREASGEIINDVVLPPWAKGDPAIFIAKQREALESPYVRAHLHQWIDLVFGYKQRGDQAVQATNVFHHLSYHGAKDLDAIEDPVERLATIGIIHNFGQTPHQVFHRAHPQQDESISHKRLDTSADSLTKLPFALLESGERVSSLLYSTKHDRLFCSAALRLNMPPYYERYLEWGFADGSIRFFSTESRKMLGLFEHLHESQISTATFIDSKTLITAGNDCVVSLWNLKFGSKAMDLHPRVSFFGHRSPVTVLATSRAFSTFLSASLDGHVYLWDINRAEFVRALDTGGRSVQCARINSVTGTVMLCCGPAVLLYSLNGELLCEQNVCAGHDADSVVSCAFFEGNGNEWLEHQLVFTGHQRGIVNVWRVSVTGDGEWMLALIKRLDHAETRAGKAPVRPAAAITCILPTLQSVYTGDEDGRVCQWDCLKSS